MRQVAEISGFTATIVSTRDAESLFRMKSILEIHALEAATRREIDEKKEEL